MGCPTGAELGELSATTLHRLLGWRPEARTRFRHDRTNRLPFEVVVVDESSMASLTMMARLLEALRLRTRLILVGDPDQLASVEAGAVLGDLVDRDARDRRTPSRTAALRTLLPGFSCPAAEDTPAARVRDGLATLMRNHRFPDDSGIGRLAAAIRSGRPDDALDVVRLDLPDVEFIELADDAYASPQQLAAIRAEVELAGIALRDAARAGLATAALDALDSHRLLCAHRRGRRGLAYWSALVTRWLAELGPVDSRADGRYAGEPLLVTTNDYEAGLYNGDTGVVIDDGAHGLVAAFGRGGAPIFVPLMRLGPVTRLHAMTVHRSQGSQFDHVTVILPPADSPLGTRETLYTAITRARKKVRLVGSAAEVVASVRRPAARATGLRDRL
ncbi:MAG: hypothetical protein NVSMB13_18870 [Mycobacteriales bacterium]